ncbi:MAG TPA: cyclic nucleotide-binding domain-containing protein [Giesbergeria sp.]|jgi:CRP/FNR family cyclic AMP-dependent transcriptional regulator|uniref:cyclic nucleotide-binding domain-containing protein n=1 Tax=Comamonadaceae TaxID=80864 RepID=UPI00138A51F8|nr:MULTISPECIES: cyclic nucleotide-binding domain-containing protein [unclassified Acidovorax]MBL8366045.1 cyclic nucleotide-binding domain-containing protein [Comamonas sp.]MCL4770663.1 cyclic nucleotide-binding domain-containing protein [Burkholderiaceae bacterium]HMZ85293.1 cyclic nucleotide-binding domain-containing protein [Giesbergeria sp.]NCU67607.1 cyclic nucleotide-binding domain-containing protein [Acidovorax sp. 210-6]HNE72520.1 cyclic nucleotide-binding domain-containing protein [G
MKGILGLLRMSSRNNKPQQDHSDSVFFSTAFANQGVDPAMLVPWEARAVEVGAKRLPASKGGKLLQALWSKDKYMAHLDQDAVRRMENFFEFAQVPPNRDLIRQDEYGNFMIVLLSGTIAVDRLQPWGEQLRLAETRPGDILGEMSLLDSGIRFSACTTLTDCEVAVLSAEGMDDMMVKDPQLAASLVALLARKLSLRLRAVSARLSENQK